MSKLSSFFARGLLILLPLIISFELVSWLLVTIEGWSKPLWDSVLPHAWYFPGVGVISFLLVASLIGIAARFAWIEKILRLPELLLDKTPIISNVYRTVKEVSVLMSEEHFGAESVVEINLPNVPFRLLGLVTTTAKDDNPIADLLEDDEIAVYLPMSYQVGGYMVMIPKKYLTPLQMKPMEALQLILTAGLGSNHHRGRIVRT